MFNKIFRSNKIKSNKDYINFVEKYISLIEDEFILIEKAVRKGENILYKIPLLVSLVNTIDALRGQNGFFFNFRKELKGENNFQNKLYNYEIKYNLRLNNLLLYLYEKYGDKYFKKDSIFQQMYSIYLDRGLKELSIKDVQKIKILFIADRRPYESIEQILKENKDIELIITLGDLEYSDIKFLKNVNNIPKLGVYGNHCDGKYLDKLGIINLHLNTFEFKGIKFGGFEGSIRYKKSDYLKMYSQEEVKILLKDFERVDIFIAHNSPFGIHDGDDNAHIGFEAFNEYIKEKSPYYMFHGHTNPKEKISLLNNTIISFIYGSEIKMIKFL